MRIKREEAPKFWPLGKKEKPFATYPRPGPHPKDYCLPLLIVIRDVLKIVDNSKEAKKIIKAGHVKVDQVVRKDHKFPTGLFDVISVDKKHYRVVPTSKGLALVEIPVSEAKSKLCKVVGKTILKKGRIQLNLNDGKNILSNKGIPTKTTLVLSLPEKKITKEIPMKKGSLAMIIRGKNSGVYGTINDFVEVKGSQSNLVILKTKDRELKIPQEYVFVIGEKKPVLKVE